MGNSDQAEVQVSVASEAVQDASFQSIDVGHFITSFQSIDVGNIITLLQALPPEDCPANKKFYSSYPKKWELLDATKKNKTIAFWQQLTPTVRERLLMEATQQGRRDGEEERQRQAITTKHDQARLFHLRVDTAAHADWCDALREKNRLELDSRNSENAAEFCPWNRLAEKFNNYEMYNYTKAVIDPIKTSPIGTYVALSGMEQVVNYHNVYIEIIDLM
jgi:hypothetical protein